MPVIGVEFRNHGGLQGLVRVFVNQETKFFLERESVPAEEGVIRKWAIKKWTQDAGANIAQMPIILNCFSLEKAKIALLRELLAPGHCAMLRRNAARRRARAQEMRSGGPTPRQERNFAQRLAAGLINDTTGRNDG